MSIPLLTTAVTLAVAAPSIPQRVPLEGIWQLTQPSREISIPAEVPGVVHTALMAAGKIPDPYFSDNEKKVQWVSDVPWTYTRTFTLTPQFLRNRKIVLRCDGLDTFATIRLNGREVAKTDNQFRAWEFDAKPYLMAGQNTIQIHFETLASFLKRNEDRPKQFNKPVQEGGKVYIRKAAFQGGWDFAPKLLTSGIWRGIGLVGWDAGRLTGVGVEQDHTQPGQVGVKVRVKADTSGAAKAHLALHFGGKKIAEVDAPVQAGGASAEMEVRNPQLWWPAGMGKANLYELRVELRNERGEPVDSVTKRIGLRTVKWIAKTDHNPLALEVNGRRFFAKGSNWVPTDSLLREDPLRVRRLVKDALAANMNLMRLWGGGYYESDAFFDLCDEVGLMVWFEFGYACSPYPSFDPDWLAKARDEAADVVGRIQTHPSIAVYSGNNEVTDRITDQTQSWTMSRDEYELLFHRTLRDVVQQVAPGAAYTPGSPEVGDSHYWSVWHGGETFEAYRKLHGFMSEYGFQAIPVPRTVEAFTTAADRKSFTTPGMSNHHKNWRDAHSLMLATARRTYRQPKDFDSSIWITQIQQADGIAMGVEHWRRDWPNSTASLVWQYNDPWPGSSWSMIDHYGRPKALYYRLKHAYAPIALSGVAHRDGQTELWVVTDRDAPKSGDIEWTLTRLDGTTVEHGTQRVAIPSGTASVCAVRRSFAKAIEREGAAKLLLWATLRVPGEASSSTTLTFEKPKELELVDPQITSFVSKGVDGYRVTLTAKHPALYAWIDVAGVDLELSDNFVHLRPGSPVVINVRPERSMTATELRRLLKVRSLFDTYAPGTPAHPTVLAQADGKIVATVDDAEVDGNPPTLESGTPHNFGGWGSLDNVVRWAIKGARAGSYRVTAVVAAPSSDSGGAFEVSVGAQRLTATVPETKSWTDYVEIDLGTLAVAKDGDVTLELRPLRKPHDYLMNLRRVTLTPVK